MTTHLLLTRALHLHLALLLRDAGLVLDRKRERKANKQRRGGDPPRNLPRPASGPLGPPNNGVGALGDGGARLGRHNVLEGGDALGERLVGVKVVVGGDRDVVAELGLGLVVGLAVDDNVLLDFLDENHGVVDVDVGDEWDGVERGWVTPADGKRKRGRRRRPLKVVGRDKKSFRHDSLQNWTATTTNINNTSITAAMALKGILKNSEAGPSKPKSGAKGSVRARVAKEDAPAPKPASKPAPKPKGKGKGVRVEEPAKSDDSDDNDFGDAEDELDTDEEIERAQAPGEKKAPSESTARQPNTQRRSA